MRLTTLALTYLKQNFSSRSVLIFTILMPIVFTFVLAVAMQGLGPDDSPARWILLLADEDHSPQSAALIHNFQADAALEVIAAPAGELASRVDAGEAPVALEIPAGFGASLLNDDTADLNLYRSAQNILDAQVVEEAVSAAVSALEGTRNTAGIAVQAADAMGAEIALPQAFGQAADLWATAAPLEGRAEGVTRLRESEIPLGAAQSSPGMMVMYVLFLTFGGGTSLLEERERGTLRRLLVMPLRKRTLLGGKLLGIFLSALAQMTLMVLVGRFALGVNWGQSPLALTVMLLAYAFCGTALGIMVAALARTAAQADGLSTVTVMAISALGGAWWPIEITPAWMQSLARAFPTYWGMQGFHDIVSRGLGLSAVLPEAGVLLAFGLGFLTVGLWRFRWEQ
ncbi:MAG: linearmycin resistance permease LnrN [Anaerolineales bacterium]